MLRYVSLLTVTACLLLACGESQVVSIPTVDPGPQGSGVVSGAVVREDGERIAGAWAGIDGTNLFARTDSGGRFTLFGVPAGDYSLRLSAPENYAENALYHDTSYLISVGPGDTLRLGSIILPVTYRWYCGSFLTDQGAWLTTFRLLDARDMTIDPSQQGDRGPVPGEVLFLHTHLDSFFFSADPSMPFAGILAWHNGAPVPEVSQPKGREGSLVGPIVRTGDDTLRIRREDDSLCDLIFIFVGSIPKPVSTTNRLLITTAPTSIVRGYCTYGNQVNYISAAETLCVKFGESQRIDWDICLVNDRTGDSCYWGNRTVWWGRTSLESGPQEDPVFQGDQCIDDSLRSTAGSVTSCGNVVPDRIEGGDVEDGSYSIFVRYFDGPTDSVSATPRLCVGLGQSGSDGEFVAKLYFSTPPRPLTKGEVWSAGKIYLPDLRCVPGKEIVSATPKTLAKSGVKEWKP